MMCGKPMGSDFWPTYCLIPRNRPHQHHLDAQVPCIFCDGWIDPTANGPDMHVRTEGGADFHRGCLRRLMSERPGLRAGEQTTSRRGEGQGVVCRPAA